MKKGFSDLSEESFLFNKKGLIIHLVYIIISGVRRDMNKVTSDAIGVI